MSLCRACIGSSSVGTVVSIYRLGVLYTVLYFSIVHIRSIFHIAPERILLKMPPVHLKVPSSMVYLNT